MKRALTAALLVILAVPLMMAIAELPPHGDPKAPVHTHVSAHYLEFGAEEAGADNIVTDVILNYRGFDTAGEVTVIFTSLVAVLAVLLAGGGVATTPPGEAIRVSPIVRFVVRLLAPFIALFAIYIILNGHITPGGGFQGGAILGALFIALALVLGKKRVAGAIPRGPLALMQGAAPLAFVLAGILGAVLTGYFLGYPQGHGTHLVREGMLLFIEAGIGIGGGAIIATLFTTMEAE